MKTLQYFGILTVILFSVVGCNKEPDVQAKNDNIELTDKPDPIQRVSGTYEAVHVRAAFKLDVGFNTYQEGNVNLIKPDGTIKGGGYKLVISPAGAERVNVSVEGASTNFAKINKTTIGTYNVYPFQNGGNTHYELRKGIKEPVALIVDRYQYSNSGIVGFKYNVALNFWHDSQTGLIHWGDTDEIQPVPSWFYPDTDHHIIRFIMLRQASNIQ